MRAIAAARTVATSLGLTAEDAVVLQESNRVTLRLLPCDVLAQVSTVPLDVARFEVDLAVRLAAAGSPVAEPDPRVYEQDGHTVTLWRYHEPMTTPIASADYAAALRRLHAGMRTLDVAVPHFTDRVEQARRLVADRDRTPDLAEDDRELLDVTLRRVAAVRGRDEQILHGEPHPGNVLLTRDGPLFVDLETCCRGPVEFDIAHAPDEVGDHYPSADQELLRDCRMLMLAMITAWRWDRDDRLPDGRRLAAEWTARIRAADHR